MYIPRSSRSAKWGDTRAKTARPPAAPKNLFRPAESRPAQQIISSLALTPKTRPFIRGLLKDLERMVYYL